MAIQYLSKKNALKIFSEEKVLSSNFKKWFLNKLIEKYDLYESHLENGTIQLLNYAMIEHSARLSELEIVEYKNFYDNEKIDFLSFKEFLESEKVVFANIYLYLKGSIVDQINRKKDKRILAVIDFQPDGDIDNIWMENVDPEVSLLMKNLVCAYNANYGLFEK